MWYSGSASIKMPNRSQMLVSIAKAQHDVAAYKAALALSSKSSSSSSKNSRSHTSSKSGCPIPPKRACLNVTQKESPPCRPSTRQLSYAEKCSQYIKDISVGPCPSKSAANNRCFNENSSGQAANLTGNEKQRQGQDGVNCQMEEDKGRNLKSSKYRAHDQDKRKINAAQFYGASKSSKLIKILPSKIVSDQIVKPPPEKLNVNEKVVLKSSLRESRIKSVSAKRKLFANSNNGSPHQNQNTESKTHASLQGEHSKNAGQTSSSGQTETSLKENRVSSRPEQTELPQQKLNCKTRITLKPFVVQTSNHGNERPTNHRILTHPAKDSANKNVDIEMNINSKAGQSNHSLELTTTNETAPARKQLFPLSAGSITAEASARGLESSSLTIQAEANDSFTFEFDPGADFLSHDLLFTESTTVTECTVSQKDGALVPIQENSNLSGDALTNSDEGPLPPAVGNLQILPREPRNEDENNALQQTTGLHTPLRQLRNLDEVNEFEQDTDLQTTPREQLAGEVIPAAPLKHKKNSMAWKANVAKTARHAGEAYTSKEGKSYPAKAMRLSCGPSCKLKCESRITEADRRDIFNLFYEKHLDQTRKWDFIRSCVDTVSPKKKSTGKRSCSNKYHFIIKSRKVRVCQEMFRSTLCISDTMIRTALKGNGTPDKRGKNNGDKRTPVEVVQSIHDHIKSFPRVASHYCRAETSYEYLEERVDSVANMYRLYKEWMQENFPGKTLASENRYYEEFGSLKIKIFTPIKDLCDTCFAYENGSEEDKNDPIKKEDYERHIFNKDQAEAMKEKDKEAALKDSSIAACAFDLQKVLLVPQCNAGAVYYKRKLNVMNFTIYDMSRHEGFCFVWHEGIAKKGANEISSHVYEFIKIMVARGIKYFKFWSDNAGSQNKNRFLFGLYIWIAAKYNIKIKHRFLIKGHTKNEADAMHSLIERKSKKSKLYVPEDWCKIMDTAKTTGKPYRVKRIQQEDVLNFHDFVNIHSSWDRDNNGQKISWSEVAEVYMDGSTPWNLTYKYHLGDSPTGVNVQHKSAGRRMNLLTYQHPIAYNGMLPLPKAKIDDLKSLCKGIIPQDKQALYHALKAGDDVTEDGYYAP